MRLNTLAQSRTWTAPPASSVPDAVPRVLVAGWFSFEQHGATAGDLLVRDVVCAWLDGEGRPYDVAHAAPFPGGVDWRTVDPAVYSHIVFACGPFRQLRTSKELLERFASSRRIGLNLSLERPPEEWNPFDVLIERDSPAAARPDLSLLSSASRVPVVGVVLIDPSDNGREPYVLANEAIRRFVASRELAAVEIDTRLDVPNRAGFRSPAEIESVISRMDVLLTTRLHGLVLAIKNEVPVIAVDPVEGGGKITRQARALGWPACYTVDEAGDDVLERALDYCVSEEARSRVRECARVGIEDATRIRRSFIAAL